MENEFTLESLKSPCRVLSKGMMAQALGCCVEGGKGGRGAKLGINTGQ
jgi:hypothetical protein